MTIPAWSQIPANQSFRFSTEFLPPTVGLPNSWEPDGGRFCSCGCGESWDSFYSLERAFLLVVSFFEELHFNQYLRPLRVFYSTSIKIISLVQRLALALAHAAGVNSWICVILAAGNRANKSFRYSKGLIPCRRQLPGSV
jgi:hypothetical protein